MLSRRSTQIAPILRITACGKSWILHHNSLSSSKLIFLAQGGNECLPPSTSQAPEPPKKSLEDAQIIPETTAIFFSLFTFGWITSLLSLGYTRPFEATDLYKLSSIIRMLKQLQFLPTRSLRSQTTSGRGRSRISGQGYRMRLLKRIFVLDVLLNMRDTGRPSVARVWSLI